MNILVALPVERFFLVQLSLASLKKLAYSNVLTSLRRLLLIGGSVLSHGVLLCFGLLRLRPRTQHKHHDFLVYYCKYTIPSSDRQGVKLNTGPRRPNTTHTATCREKKRPCPGNNDKEAVALSLGQWVVLYILCCSDHTRIISSRSFLSTKYTVFMHPGCFI